MPATYGAVHPALSSALAALGEGGRLPRGPLSLLDLGAGTGAASWAAAGLLELSSISCLEYAPSMEAVGKSLMRRGEGPLKGARWKRADLASQPIGEEADVVIASYMLNELEQSAGLRAAEKAWQAAGKLLLLVEPGTPEGYGVLRGIREALLRRGPMCWRPARTGKHALSRRGSGAIFPAGSSAAACTKWPRAGKPPMRTKIRLPGPFQRAGSPAGGRPGAAPSLYGEGLCKAGTLRRGGPSAENRLQAGGGSL